MVDIFSMDKTTYTNGRIVNGLDSKIWIERFRQGGEFELKGPPTPYLRNTLARGTLISHINTHEVMMVESHAIDDSTDESPQLVIKGRSAEQIALGNRVAVTSNMLGFNPAGTDLDLYSWDYVMESDYGWNQAAMLIYYSLESSRYGSQENLPNFGVLNFIVPLSYFDTPFLPTQSPRVTRKLESIYSAVSDILDEIDGGIKTRRPNGLNTKLNFIIHRGFSKIGSVQFDYNKGDIEDARYLWSSEDEKNAGYMVGGGTGIRVTPPGVTGWDLKILGVDESSWDVPHPDILGQSRASFLTIPLRQEISKHDVVEILDASISPTSRYRYKKDYDIGDLVYVRGNYGAESIMRVVEYAITEDKDGVKEFPTLSFATNPSEIYQHPPG